jgi:hypothetical protein
LGLLVSSGVGAEERPLSALRYELDVQLDVSAHALHGREHIHFENSSRRDLNALVFHLYPNAFSDDRSVFMREGGSGMRGRRLGRPGRMRVTSLRASGRDLLRAGAVHDELIAGDHTQLKIDLPQRLPPTAALELDLAFEVELPALVARAGFADEFHMLGQWFPKLARFGPDGHFVSFPYHGFGEFFADFADYDVRLSLPANYLVAASGEVLADEVTAGQRHLHWIVRRVHDVALATYPYFEVREQQVGAVRLRVFAPRGYGAAVDRQLRVLAAALPYFEAHYGKYPYPELTIIIPPAAAYAASGMEYPRLFVSAGPFWALPSWLPDPAHDFVSTHELAHQWFSGLLASDEVSHPMLDEGLAEWASLDFLRSYYRRTLAWSGALGANRAGVGAFEVTRALFVWHERTWPSSLEPAYRYHADTLAAAVYMRPALVFEWLAARHGRAPLTAALGRYARSQRFSHPTPDDLFDALDHAFGPGVSAREARPALAGQRDASLGGAAASHPPSGLRFLSELTFLVEQLLHWLGP